MRSLIVTALFAAAIAPLEAPLLTRAAFADDAVFQFQNNTNPAGNWSYGYSPGPGMGFNLFTTETNLGGGLNRWSAPNGASLSMACSPVVNEPGVTMVGSVLSARLAANPNQTVLRWTAPSNDTWHVRARFTSEAGYLGASGASSANGTQANQRLGWAVAVGDVNGDGYGDVVAGTNVWSNSQVNEGQIELFLGGANGISPSPAWSYEPNVVDQYAGMSVAVADFDRDGYADIAEGEPGTGAVPGNVRIFKGSSTFPALSSTRSGSSAWQFGTALATGDFNGDGYPDLAVGLPGANAVEVAYGGSTGLGAFGPMIHSPDPGSNFFGQSLASTGDVNGDGKDDLIVGAQAYSSYLGRAYVFMGSSGGVSVTPSWTFTGLIANGELGFAVSSAGDENHDGYADVLVGAPYESSGGTNAGAVRLFRGSSTGLSTSPVWTWFGAPNSNAGMALSPAGDVDGDGYADFLIGAPGYTHPEVNEGEAFLYLGGSGATPTLHSTFEMNQANAHCGRALASGDVNGDLTPDLVVVATDYKAGSTASAGRILMEMGAGPPRPPFARTVLRLYADAVMIAQDTLNTATGRDTVTLEATVAENAGHTIDIEVGDNGGLLPYEAVGIDASIETNATPANPLGPVITLGTSRFASILGPPAFEAAAFDPIHRYLASNGHLYDVCGNLHSAGPDGPGIAWDMVTQKFWNISFDAGNQRWMVASWDTATATFTTVFNIPRVLTVPVTGADTLEDARGIAVDSSYVYVVDAGPDGLVPRANAWFKFTRAGQAVASLKGSSFAANSSYDIVDDIVYCPFASPTEPGRFLVAVQHTGILVLDANGAMRDTAYWRSQGLPGVNAPRAVAGIAIDPVSGDLFVEDNDRGLTRRWVRLPDGPTTYLFGDNDPIMLELPVTECTASSALFQDPIEPSSMYCPQTPFCFGVAFRTADMRGYTVDYSTGTLWKFDPRGGRGTRVGETGLQGVWGLAYDASRDRLYGAQNVTGTQIWSINPRTAVATALPQLTPYSVTDIGFEPNSGLIYAVSGGGSTARLISIDRDTGAATVVGPTHDVRGLDYDPVRGALVGITYDDSLFSINPGTGAASLITRLPWTMGWEGLAVGLVGVAGSTDVPLAQGGARMGTPLALAVAPQPSHASASLTFALFENARVRLDIYDVSGRHVRRVVDGAFTPGAHTLAWDGRVDSGEAAAAGIYFVRLEAGGRNVTARVVRIR